MQDDRVEFVGTGGDFFVFGLIQGVLVLLTLGIYFLLLPGAVKNWKLSRTLVEGVPMRHKGSLLDGLGSILANFLLIVCSAGLAMPWIVARNKRYDLEHTFLEDGRRFTFAGSGGQVIGQFLIGLVAIPCTLGLAFPWVYAMWKRWEWDNTRLSNDRADTSMRGSLALESVGSGGWREATFDGQGSEFFGIHLVNTLLSIATFGLYGAWGAVKLFRWEFEHVTFAA